MGLKSIHSSDYKPRAIVKKSSDGKISGVQATRNRKRSPNLVILTIPIFQRVDDFWCSFFLSYRMENQSVPGVKISELVWFHFG
ncbi:hypothetical protein V6N13_058339 [Hibiscus sabdariffa]